MKKLLQSLFVIMFFAISAFGQNRTITGTVTSKEDNLPIPGVSIRLNGAAGGTTTGSNGKFSISVPSNVTSLQFSFVGYLTQTRPVTASGVVNVSLDADAQGLSEVVVVGYGTQTRKEITGSVGSVKGETLSNLAGPSFDKQLAGQVTGVQASNTSGVLGQPARIRIRGTNSISSSADPLYVVDGVPYISGDQGAVTSYNPLGDINPNDIESYDVLKDGAATAIYGSRAANGVILITTKRGKTGAAKISYDSWFALATPSKKYDLLNAEQFVQIANEKITNYGDDGNYAVLSYNPDGSVVNTDWQDEVFRTGFQQNHSLSISGATDKTNYYVSMGFADLKGTTVSNAQRKYNFRTKLEQKALGDRLTLGMNTAFTYTKNDGLNTGTGGGALSGNVAASLRALPNVAVKNPDGSYNVDFENNILGSGANLIGIDDNYPNISYIVANNIYRSQAINLTGNAFARLKIVEGLNATTQIGVNYLNVEDYQYWNPNHGDGYSYNGIADQYSQPLFRYNWQNTLAYSKTFGDHKLDAVAGLEFQKTRQRYFLAEGTGISNEYFGTNGNIISNTFQNQFIGGDSFEKAYASIFGRINYSYLDKYLLSASIRRDKISDLPIGNQGATLPGASVGWRISKEGFFANSSALKFINDLKLRGGWAKVGNVEIGNYPYAGLYGPVQYGSTSGLGYSRLGNDQLRFETSKKLDLGLDISMFDSRVQVTADYFKNNIDNLILDSPTPASVGVPTNSISTNVGSMYNKGWEFAITTTNISNDSFSWTSNLNLSFVKNKVTALANNNSDLVNTYNITRVGQSIGEFYGYVSKGVNAANGNPLWEKADGSIIQSNVDNGGYATYNAADPTNVSTASVLNTADKKLLGQSNPTWFGGFNNTFRYKAFDLGVMLTFGGGNKIYNFTRQEALNNQKFQNNGTEILNRWTTPGQVTDVPRLYYGQDASILQTGNLNSRFLEDGKFLRAQNLSLGYTIDPKVLSAIKLNSVRFYVQVQNAFVITGYSGLDPELASSASTNRAPGVDYNVNPVPRTFTLGVNVGF
jgi:TonB-linked SusC/RagA family outer membrane protein